ncbi:MAG: 2Fe-2S iron-sulfur cluster binding domain-containing protein [Burkholderiaceae bacterium]|nr:2Fe-2S iron-sulfur cluster binding domain-containing protein [Burkholderiaceae bacterium]
MAQALTVSRAAHLVGVPRGALQRMIRSGELASYDGLVSTDELLRAFPQVRLEDAGLFEKTTRIREESFGRRVRERIQPAPEVLSHRLFAQSQELAEVRRHLQAYHELVASMIERLSTRDAQSPNADDLLARLESGLAKILGSESDNPLDAMTDMLNLVCANVTVRPSGREFLVEGNDSLLQAALKAGLSFNYGCGSGNCGLCKARLISGEVRAIQPSDYVLSAAEKQQGYVLLCTHTALGDLAIETLEAAGPADIPRQDLVAKVRAIDRLGEDTRMLHLQTPRSARLRFLAGQSVSLGSAADDSEDFHAAYPIASCPCDDRNLLFHVARDADDPFAVRLFAGELRAGDSIGVHGPSGDFVLAPEHAAPVVFLACDTGFAPVKSLIEHVIAIESVEWFSLYWVATRPDGHYLENLCESWADAFDEFRYVALAADGVEQGAREAAERAAHDNDPEASVFFVAGPAAFVDTATRLLADNGVPADRLRRFAGGT